MPLIQILSDKKKSEYELPPVFSAKERKHFLKLPASLQAHIDTFPTLTNKVGFQLMFGYFLARKKFFSPESFSQKDIRFLCNQFGVMHFAFDTENYKGSTYTRHRQLILDHFAFQPYQPRVHNSLVMDSIKEQIYSWEDPKFIVNYILEWLEWRRIEFPSYSNLQLLLTQSIRKRNKIIKQKFSQLLNSKQKIALDELMEKQSNNGKEEYVLTSLHKLSPSDSPSQIKTNISKLRTIQTIFETIEPLLKKLELNDNAIRHFGEIVENSESSHIIRKKDIDCYFNLATFCAYQRCVFEDWMARTLISVCKIATSKAISREKERLFDQRKKNKKNFQKVISIAENKTKLLEKIKELAWMEIPATKKEEQLQCLLPKDKEQTDQHNDIEQIIKDQQFSQQDDYYRYLAEESQSLQKKVNPIIKNLTFNIGTSDSTLIQAIEYFRDKEGVITKAAPVDFLKEEEKLALKDETGKFQVSLYKILFFQKVMDAIDRGKINLKYTYKYRGIDNHLIPKDLWEKGFDTFLDKANLSHLKDVKSRINDYKKLIHYHFRNTNDNIISGRNKYFRQNKNNKYYVVTPRVEKDGIDNSLFPPEATISLSEVLSTIDSASNFLEHFEHLQPLFRRKKPDKALFFAGITAYGCNLGISTMAKAASQIRSSQLENTTNWYFNLNNINRANDAISNFTNKLPFANLYRKKQGELRTSSDGQKIKLISTDTIFGNYSGKYYRKGKGVVSYTFIDERYIPFYSVIIDSSVREATYVLDGLLHNNTIKSNIHTTDTHGYTEALFGLTDLLGFEFRPNIAKMLRQTLYTFKEHSIPYYKEKGYSILPKAYIDIQLIEENWSEILRLITSLKLKYCTASQIFNRFNSYAKQHPLYAALKEYGRLVKTLHILRFTNNLEMRQDNRKSGNAIESSNRFSSAIFFANGGEMIYLTRTEQQIADACKNLIKNAIICWNYLYLTRKVQKTKNKTQAEELIRIAKQKTVNAWKHIYFNGTYDFSQEKLADSFNLLHSQNYALNFV